MRNEARLPDTPAPRPRAAMAVSHALDVLRCAVVLTDQHGAVLHANHAARMMLDDGGLVQSADGILRASLPSAAKELHAAIAAAVNDRAHNGKAKRAVRLTEPDAPPRFAYVLSMSDDEPPTRREAPVFAAVFIGAPPSEQDSAQMMAAAFGLTPAETRVLAGLLAGRTLADMAAVLGIATTTAKSHLYKIFAKTGVSRQAELVRLAPLVVPPIL